MRPKPLMTLSTACQAVWRHSTANGPKNSVSLLELIIKLLGLLVSDIRVVC